MAARAVLVGLLAGVTLALVGCASDVEPRADNPETDDNEVKVDTGSPEARRQYDANVAFANGYVPRCNATPSGRPRVLVTGFGRFMSIANNATGRIVSTMVPEARYPDTVAPPRGEIDPPDTQLSVALSTLNLPTVGDVDVCAMILPVYWDLAAILIAKEMNAFDPSMVLMNGVAGGRQPVWIELGAVNKAAKLDDGSNQLRPATPEGQPFAKLVETASKSEDARPNFLSWRAVEGAARAAAEQHANDLDLGTRFGDVLSGAKLAGFPRSSNTYLCNNVTYVTGYLMAHPRRQIRLLRASPAIRGKINEVRVMLEKDLTRVPRVFVHWPSELATKHHAAGAEVMRAVIDAQLAAIARGDLPTNGDNAIADPTLQGSGTF